MRSATLAGRWSTKQHPNIAVSESTNSFANADLQHWGKVPQEAPTRVKTRSMCGSTGNAFWASVLDTFKARIGPRCSCSYGLWEEPITGPSQKDKTNTKTVCNRPKCAPGHSQRTLWPPLALSARVHTCRLASPDLGSPSVRCCTTRCLTWLLGVPFPVGRNSQGTHTVGNLLYYLRGNACNKFRACSLGSLPLPDF